MKVRGNMQIYNDDYVKIIPYLESKGFRFNVIITDPPYGMINPEWDVRPDIPLLWRLFHSVLNPNGVIIIMAMPPFSAHLIISNEHEFRFEWIWNKVAGSNFMNLKKYPFRITERVLIFSPSAEFTFNPIRVMRTQKSLKRHPAGKKAVIKSEGAVDHYGVNRKNFSILSADGKRHPVDIVKFSRIDKDRYKVKHPTRKPVALMDYFIRTYSNPCDWIFDPFMGSGTAGVAAIQNGRKFIGVEINEDYFNIAKNRIENTTKKMAL